MSTAGAPRKDRTEVYDWLRGLASIAVILGHFKPFGLSKIYFTWSVHAFVLVTMALVSGKSFGWEKFVRRLSYVVFVYLALLLTFRPLFLLAPAFPNPGLHVFFLNIRTVFIENPYFHHLWYLLLYFQMLVFLLFAAPFLKRIPTIIALLVSLIISQTMFWLTHYVTKSVESALLPSWLFVMAVGYYGMPHLAEKIRVAEKGRWIRCLVASLALGFVDSSSFFKKWLIVSENRVFVLNTTVFFLAIYFLAEIFFLLKKTKYSAWFIRYIFLASRYTLIIYIAHQGIKELLGGVYGWSDPFFLTVFSLTVGMLYSHWVHRLFLFLEKKVGRRN